MLLLGRCTREVEQFGKAAEDIGGHQGQLGRMPEKRPSEGSREIPISVTSWPPMSDCPAGAPEAPQKLRRSETRSRLDKARSVIAARVRARPELAQPHICTFRPSWRGCLRLLWSCRQPRPRNARRSGRTGDQSGMAGGGAAFLQL